MRSYYITALLFLGSLCIGCAAGSSRPTAIAEDDSRHILFDAGGFRFRSELEASSDTLRFYDSDVVLGEPDRPADFVGTDPFSPTPYAVYVYEPDSVTVGIYSLKGHALGDYGPFYLSKGQYSFWLEGSGMEPRTVIAEIRYRGTTNRRVWTYVR